VTFPSCQLRESRTAKKRPKTQKPSLIYKVLYICFSRRKKGKLVSEKTILGYWSI
jgi:hypothetical protein